MNEHYQTEKNCKNVFNLVLGGHWLAEQSPKSVKDECTKSQQLTARDLMEGVTLSNVKASFKKINKEHYQTENNHENSLNLILGAVVGRARPKICKRSICQILSADFRSHQGKSKTLF